MIERKLTEIERGLLGETWAILAMSFWARLRFFRDTAEWPGYYSKETTRVLMQQDIDAERADGKTFCANKKLARAREAGLDVR